MDLSWIEDFRALVDARSFSLAARRRSISQSAFSKRIRSLERVLNGELVQRQHMPISLTALGEQFYRDSEAIIASMNIARDNAARLFEAGQNEITFSAASSLAHSFYPRWIMKKRQLVPKIVPLLISSRSWTEESIAMQQGEVDYFLTYCSPDVPTAFDRKEFDYRVLGYESIIPVSAPIPGGTEPMFSLDRHYESKIPYLARLPGSYIGTLVERLTKERNPPMVRAFAGTNGENLMGLLTHGNGISWMPADRIRDQLASRMLVPAGDLRWEIKVEVRLYRRERREAPIIEKFWASIASDKTEFP